MQIDERKYELWMQTLQRYDKIGSVGGQTKELCDKYRKIRENSLDRQIKHAIWVYKKEKMCRMSAEELH